MTSAAAFAGAPHPASMQPPRAHEPSRARALPHDIEVEAALLGGLITYGNKIEALADLEIDDFYHYPHKVIFESMRNLSAAGTPIDIVTLEHEIHRQGKLDAIGGIAFLGELVIRYPTADNTVEYAKTTRQLSRNRRSIIALSSALERAHNWLHDPADLISEVAGDLGRFESEIRIGPSGARYGSPFLEWLGDAEPGNDPADVFDAHGLIVRAEPSVILGDPKVGKTLLVEDLAIHLAAGRREWCSVPLYRRCRVLALMREDSDRTTRRRIFQMARGAGIEHWELDGWLEVDGITPLYFDEPKHVAQLARQLKNYDVVMIDSLSTIHNGDENSVEAMAPVMNQWRDLSLTTKTAIVIIHHFRKRQTDGRSSPESVGGVLQRARGSSIIGATTRHAVGISTGPEKGQVVIEVESNHDVDVEPFVIGRKSGVTAAGLRYLTHERVGSLRDARIASDASTIDPITLAVVRQAGPDGIGSRDLRTYVNEQMKMAHGTGVRPARVDLSAKRLEAQDAIELLKMSRKWRVVS